MSSVPVRAEVVGRDEVEEADPRRYPIWPALKGPRPVLESYDYRLVAIPPAQCPV